MNLVDAQGPVDAQGLVDAWARTGDCALDCRRCGIIASSSGTVVQAHPGTASGGGFTDSTLFEIGSNTKVFTAVLLHSLRSRLL